jgi:hypothetical protein
MLPKTVIDATIVYSFVSCGPSDDGKRRELKLKITPTLVSKALPDTSVGLKSINPATLKSFWQDKNITLKTYGGSHILSSIGSSPANQVGQIITNVLTGAGKIVAMSLGVPGADADPSTNCGSGVVGTAQDDRDRINVAQTTIRSLQRLLIAPDITEAQAKLYTAQIQALQSSVSALEAGLTLTVQKTIDPGFTPIDILNIKGPPRTKPFGISANGLVATFSLSEEILEKTKWYPSFSPDERQSLDVNVYLDFARARPRVGQSSEHWPTPVGRGNQFREVAYIPVLVFQGPRPVSSHVARAGSRQASASTEFKNQLNDPAQTMAFGQFGIARSLPLSANLFENLSWSVAFQDNGEITDASFSSKSIGVALTGLFSNAASSANTIVTEQRAAANAPSSETVRLTAENNALQAKINNINYNETLRGLIAKGLAPQ